MAEGDTILRAARRIDTALAGEEVAVSAPNPRGRLAGVERLDGLRVERVETRGKNLLIRLGSLALHSHLGMSGSWHVYRRGARWRKPAGSAWAVLRGDEWEAVQFGGPTLRVLSTARLRRDPHLARLGIDILEADLDPGLCSLRTAPERELGDALLDQALIAGIGNIFKSEACFAARADPWCQIVTLSEDELRAVLTSARNLMQASVSLGRPHPVVYRRAGAPCPRCGTRIAARGQGDADRTTYWCPSCQAG